MHNTYRYNLTVDTDNVITPSLQILSVDGLGTWLDVQTHRENTEGAMSHMEPSRRDTQFQDFANLLMQEIDEQVGEVVQRGMEHDAGEMKVGQELASRWQTVIARRAYDLVWHALESCLISERAYSLVRHYYPLGNIEASEVERHFDREELLQDIPDMTEWPERKEP
jgi:hypothetical protein